MTTAIDDRALPTAHVEQAWGCRIRRYGRAHLLTAGERLVAVATIIAKVSDFRAFEHVDCLWADWTTMVPQAREAHVPGLLIVGWSDVVRYCDVAKIGQLNLIVGQLGPLVRIQAGKLSPVTEGVRW